MSSFIAALLYVYLALNNTYCINKTAFKAPFHCWTNDTNRSRYSNRTFGKLLNEYPKFNQCYKNNFVA